MTTPGPVRLRLTPVPLALWLDGQKQEPQATLDLPLTAGLHTLTVALPADPKAPGFRLELQETPGSPARAQPVVGK